MSVDSIAHQAEVLAQAAATTAEARALETETRVLKKALDAEQQTAAALLALMGVGTNLNVVA